jgi:hypothetical protein
MPAPTTTAPKKASSALPIKVIKEQKIVVKKQKPEVVVPHTHKHEKSPHAMFASPMSILHVSPMAPMSPMTTMDYSSKLKHFGYFVLGLVLFAFIASFLLMQTRQFLIIVFVLFYMASDMYFQVSHRKDVLLLRLIFLLWIVAILVLKKNKPQLVKKHAYLLYYYGPLLVLFLNIFLKSSSKMLM